jgi:hypothetical protein
MPSEQLFSYIIAKTSCYDVCFVIEQYAELDFNSASGLKQQSTGIHVTPQRHIILILSQPVFALTP